jgi:HEPN domain-containing protein
MEIICYHCQQCAEKYLKGFLAWHGKEIIRTHDLTELNKICTGIDASFDGIEEKCLKLTDFGINIRYPYPLDILESDMKRALQDAGEIMSFVKKQIK